MHWQDLYTELKRRSMFRTYSQSWARCYCGGSENIFSVHLLCIHPYLFTFGKMHKVSSPGEFKTREQHEQSGIKKIWLVSNNNVKSKKKQSNIKWIMTKSLAFLLVSGVAHFGPRVRRHFATLSFWFDLKSAASYPVVSIFHPGAASHH